jgi:hypothetical protein
VNKSHRFKQFSKFIKIVIKSLEIATEPHVAELNEILEIELEIKKKKKIVRRRRNSNASYTDANIGDYFKKQDRSGTPKRKDFSNLGSSFFTTGGSAKKTPRREAYRTRSSTKNKEMKIQHFQVELVSYPSYSGMFTNEYSKMSFESNIKRPFSLGQGCSSAKTISYSSYYSNNVSQFSFNPLKTISKSDYTPELNNSNHSARGTGINSLLSYKVQTLPKLKKTRTPSSKKKRAKKSFLLELIENKLKTDTNVVPSKQAKTEIPLRKVVSKRFYQKQAYLSPFSSEKKFPNFQEDVILHDNHHEEVRIEISQEDEYNDITVRSSLLNKKRMAASPMMTRSAYKKSRKNSRNSHFTDDEILEYCTPIIMRTKEFHVKQSPRRNLSNLFKQINK